ncbi:hypothetical protein PVK06_040069 [Gossypium arboreum]|uniref:Uncharacterized protein n=1 Tax=Gossypium arboreum TaxID=29729 RepID=A0ABR0N4H1_GOSAR|nr:hypothetical protein PVK06_040069 [Gossypium arboreum]
MALRVEVANMGWDLCLRAQSRRALTMNSIWLRPLGVGNRRGSALVDPVRTAMDYDLEDAALIEDEGKKRSIGEIDDLPEKDDINKNADEESLTELWFYKWYRRWIRRKRRKEFLTAKLSELVEDERDDTNLAEMIDMKIQLNFEIEKDEYYLEQRARLNWLKFGDRNMTFFHSQATQRRRRNQIAKLKNKMEGKQKTLRKWKNWEIYLHLPGRVFEQQRAFSKIGCAGELEKGT